jgi:hypothetical protein
MNSGNQGPHTAGIDVENLSVIQIIRALKPVHIGAIVASLLALCSAAYVAGTVLDPRVETLSAENARLKSVIDVTQVAPDQNRYFSINRFIAGPDTDISALTPMFGGRLYVAPLEKEWVPYTANDLTLLADVIGVPQSNIRNAMPETFKFNQQNPPRIWTVVNAGNAEKAKGIPYVQVSVISRDRAQHLMRAIGQDAAGILNQPQEIIQTTLQAEFPPGVMDFLQPKIDKLDDVKFLTKTFFNGALTAQEFRTVFGKADASTTSQQKIDAIANRVRQQLEARFEVPGTLLKNGMGSLSEVTPEAGLLFGRLLFYVFGVSLDGRVDVNQLIIGYAGSYARLSRTIKVEDPENPGKDETYSVIDEVLIISTKSDFCLVHVHVPELNDRLRAVSRKSHEWLMQVRMREFR